MSSIKKTNCFRIQFPLKAILFPKPASVMKWSGMLYVIQDGSTTTTRRSFFLNRFQETFSSDISCVLDNIFIGPTMKKSVAKMNDVLNAVTTI